MSENLKDDLIENLVKLVPSISDAVNEILAITQNNNVNVSYSKLLEQIVELNGLLAVALNVTEQGLKKLNDEDSDTKIYSTFFEAIKSFSKSIEVFIVLISKEYGKKNIKRRSRLQKEIKSDGKSYDLESAVDYLFRGSKSLADTIELIFE